MRLRDVINEFESILNDPAVTVAIGRKELHRNDAPPRVVFVRKGGPITATQEIGRQDIGGQSTTQIHQRELSCDVYCWGSDEDETEQLLHNVVVAMRRAILGSYRLGNETWLSEEELRAGDVVLGECVVLEAIVHIPIVDQLVSLVTPSGGLTHTGTFARSLAQYGWPQLTYGSGYKYGGNPEAVC